MFISLNFNFKNKYLTNDIYEYKNNKLLSSGAGGSGNNSHITKVSIGTHMSVNKKQITRIAEIIIN